MSAFETQDCDSDEDLYHGLLGYDTVVMC